MWRVPPRSSTLLTVLIGTVLLVSSCTESPTSPPTEGPALAGAPSDGNGKKVVKVFHLDLPDFATCPNGETLRLKADGWVQSVVSTNGNSTKVEAVIFHATHTWFNSAGQTFVDREIGLNFFFIDENGDLIAFESGHVPVDGIYGRFVINLTTGEVTFVAGNLVPEHVAQACNALT
jgi:hypothetical protein